VLGNTYRIQRKIAAGGMGAVYEARHVRLAKKTFAVKLLHADAARDAEVFARFRREAEVTTELGYPHIVDVLDFNELPDGRPYMVMEFLRGEDLGDTLQRVDHLPIDEVIHIMEQVGGALQAAHDLDVVHRDIKPQNIFLVDAGPGRPLVKVLDFGISKIRHSTSIVTKDRTIFGTVYYMSPEQAVGAVQDIDATTDIFAAGVICYQLLSGTHPFDGPTMPGVIYQICHEEPLPLSQRVPELPAEVDAVISRALAKVKEERYQRITDFVQDLVRALSGEAISAEEDKRSPTDKTTWPPEEAMTFTGEDTARDPVAAAKFGQGVLFFQPRTSRNVRAPDHLGMFPAVGRCLPLQRAGPGGRAAAGQGQRSLPGHAALSQGPQRGRGRACGGRGDGRPVHNQPRVLSEKRRRRAGHGEQRRAAPLAGRCCGQPEALLLM